jgi:hypothetical protein
MKRRSSLLNYILALLTGGQFAFVWLFLMAFDVNKARNNYVPRLAAVCVAFIVLYVVYLSLVGYSVYQIGTASTETYPSLSARTIPMAPLLLMAIMLLACAVYLLVRIANFVREGGAAFPRNSVLVLLFFFYFASLPMLQNRLNAYNDKNT